MRPTKRTAMSEISVDADEDGAGANVCAENNGLVAVVAAVYRLAVTGVDSDVGHAGAAIGVVDQVARLRLSSAHGTPQGEVAGGPVVEVDSDGGQGVGDQHGAVLHHAELGVGGGKDGCTLAGCGSL